MDPDPKPDPDPFARVKDPGIWIRIRTKMLRIPNTDFEFKDVTLKHPPLRLSGGKPRRWHQLVLSSQPMDKSRYHFYVPEGYLMYRKSG